MRARASLLPLCLILCGCIETVMRGQGAPDGGSRPRPSGHAREWRIGGVYDARHVVDPQARPLAAKLRVGETLDLWCMPVGDHAGRLPEVRWVSSRDDVARVTPVRGGSTGAFLRGLAEGESEVHAVVDVDGGVRADLFYYCCGACTEQALPRCEHIRIDRVVVTR